jgi:hypothetical protein
MNLMPEQSDSFTERGVSTNKFKPGWSDATGSTLTMVSAGRGIASGRAN